MFSISFKNLQKGISQGSVLYFYAYPNEINYIALFTDLPPISYTPLTEVVLLLRGTPEPELYASQST